MTQAPTITSAETLLGLIPKIRSSYAQLAAARIQVGALTTWEFREYLRNTGRSVEEALLLGGCPCPFPLADPVRCCNCGEVFGEAEATARCAIAERISGPAERCHPGEYTLHCPECQCAEWWEPAIRCAECEERPCVCQEAKEGKENPQ